MEMWCHVSDARSGYAIIGQVVVQAAKKTDSRLAARLAALASLGAAVIHFAVVPTHWQEWMPSGVFFVTIAVFQLIWAHAVLARPTTALITLGILCNAGVIVLWALSRTMGAPFGPHAGEPELVQAADLCALLLQVYVVMGAGWIWHRGRQAEPIPGFVNGAALLGFSVVIASAATIGAAAGLRHDHHAPAGAEADFHSSTDEHGEGHQGHSEPTAPPVEGSTHPLNAPPHVDVAPPALDPSHETDSQHHHEE